MELNKFFAEFYLACIYSDNTRAFADHWHYFAVRGAAAIPSDYRGTYSVLTRQAACVFVTRNSPGIRASVATQQDLTTVGDLIS